MKKRLLLASLSAFIFSNELSAQIRLSEVSQSNISTIVDEDNEYDDWFEIRNDGATAVDLNGYIVGKNANQFQWTLPAYSLLPGEHKLIFASGKNRIPTIDHYETIISANDAWQYIVPTTEPASSWRLPGTTLTGWLTGIGGIGFGDSDDGTTVGTCTSVYSRKTFTLTNPAEIERLVLFMDYDDGFVAYINGVEIARANIGTVGTNPAFNAFAASSHEALVYQGMATNMFEINLSALAGVLVTGENVLSIQTHNNSATSTDLTGNAYLAVGLNTTNTYFSATLPWMNLVPPTAWHTNFTLSTGDVLTLADPTNTLLEQFTLTQIPVDHSSNNNGTSWCISPNPTPGASNSASCFALMLEKPIYSVPAGIYASAQTVTLTSNQVGAEIRYTLNGSIPTATSALYTGPITVPATKVLAARCFDPAGTALPSLTEKNSYIINEAYIGLPVISISTDSLNLYDVNTGIYVLGPPDYNTNYPYFGANFWEDWEKYSYIEYISTDSTQKFEGAIGLKIHGGWSRAQPQKSFRVKCRDDYGMSKINYALIPDKPYVTKYKDFNLRNGGNDYNGSRMRDAFMQRLTKNTHTMYMGYSPTIVFLNGEYFGEYEIRETLNNDYIENNTGFDSDSVSVLTENYMAFEANDGTMDNFWPMYNAIAAADPASPTFFALADSLIDLENYADYIITETYYGNGDWSNGQANNIKYWNVPGEKWKMLLMDLDFGYGLYGATANDNFLVQATNDAFIHMDIITGKLLANQQFRTYFIDRYADLINTIWQQNKVVSTGNTMINEVAPWIPRHHTRWSGNMNNFLNTMTNMQTWNNNRITGARNVVQSHFALTGQVTFDLDVQPAGAGRIHISTLEPSEQEYPWNGVYFKGVPVKITAIANPGYSFDHWSPNSLFPANNSNQVLTITPTVNAGFTAWFTGSTETNPLEISELMPNPENSIDGGDWIEIHNKLTVPLDVSGMTIEDTNYFHVFTFPLQTIIPADGRLVVVEDTALFHAQYPFVTNYIGNLGFSLKNAGQTLYIKKANDFILTEVTYSTSSPWPIGTNGYGRSIEFEGNSQGQNDPNAWFAGCVAGSPGEPYFACDSTIIVSEINYKSISTSDAGDWFEIHSTSTTDIDLSNWTMSDGGITGSYVLPVGTILPANGYLVIVKDTALFHAIHPNVLNVVGPSLISLGGSDGIILYNDLGVNQFSVNYENSAPWTTEPDGNGKTLELLSSTGLMCDATNWFAGCPDGSPGKAYLPGCGLGVEELTNDELQIYPNPTSSTLTINMLVGGDIVIYNLMGEQLFAKKVNNGLQTIDVSTLKAGFYFIQVGSSRKMFSKI